MLRKTGLAKQDAIISELLEIHFPDNCYVTIASQPIDALDEFKANSYCIFKIEPWGIKQVKSLMATFQIADDTIKGDDSSISEYLLKKSQGNALYLNYILRQLRNSNVNKELIIIARLAGVAKKVSFHTARHTNATLLIYNGVNITTVQKLLGHKSVKTTQIYTNVMDATIISDLEKNHSSVHRKKGK